MGELAHSHPGQSELAQMPTRTTVDRVAVAQPHRTGVSGLTCEFLLRGLPLPAGAGR